MRGERFKERLSEIEDRALSPDKEFFANLIAVADHAVAGQLEKRLRGEPDDLREMGYVETADVLDKLLPRDAGKLAA